MEQVLKISFIVCFSSSVLLDFPDIHFFLSEVLFLFHQS